MSLIQRRESGAMASTWPDRRLLQLFDIELPIVQAPMAGAQGAALAAAVSEAGGLGSLPCALLDAEAMRAELAAFRAMSSRPVNVNFFCHDDHPVDATSEAAWREVLAPYYAELGIAEAVPNDVAIVPFDDARCAVVEEVRPEVVSFHFGLPADDLLDRVRASGARVIASATTVPEAEWLAANGCDAIIAQGAEAGGHRGMFLSSAVDRQVGTMALVPQVVDAVDVPVIAAGGIADSRGVAAGFVLGASAVQIGTGYLLCPESTISTLHRAALRSPAALETAVTNVFTGRPARSIVNRLVDEVGPLSAAAPGFPRATGAVLPLRGVAETGGDTGFTALWSGQAARLAVERSAGELTGMLAAGALQRLP
jgi:nitronate monooxygenase